MQTNVTVNEKNHDLKKKPKAIKCYLTSNHSVTKKEKGSGGGDEKTII